MNASGLKQIEADGGRSGTETAYRSTRNSSNAELEEEAEIRWRPLKSAVAFLELVQGNRVPNICRGDRYTDRLIHDSNRNSSRT